MKLNLKQLKRKRHNKASKPIPLKVYGQPIINAAINHALTLGSGIITRLVIDPPVDYFQTLEDMEIMIESALTGIPVAKLIRPYQLKRKKEELEKKASNPNYCRKKLAKEQRYYENELQEYQLSQV